MTMSVKTQLASLYVNRELPINDYMNLSDAIALEKEHDIIKMLSEYNLPEITKLICGSETLLALDWAERYRKVAPLYRNVSTFDVKTVLIQYMQSDSSFESEILLYADKTIIMRFKNFCEEQNKTLTQQPNIKNAKNKKNKTSESYKSMNTDDQNLTSDNTDAPNLKTEMDKLWEKYVDKVNEYAKKVISPEIESQREKAYTAIKFITISDEEKFLQDFIQTGVLPEEMHSKFREPTFCEKMISILDKETYRSHAIPIIAKFYEENLIDLSEGLFYEFVASNPLKLCDYLVESYQQDHQCIHDPDKNIFFDIAIDLTINSNPQFCSLASLWNCFTEVKAWEWLILRISENHKSDINNMLSHFLVGVKGKAANVVNEFICNFHDDELSLSLLDIYSELFRLQENQQKDLIISIIRKLVQEKQKTQRQLKGSLNRQSQELFSAIYRPVTQLETLTTNLRNSENKTDCSLVASQLINILVSLREGLEIMDVMPLANLDAWKNGYDVDFEPDIHHLLLKEKGRPSKVQLKTLGFKYPNDEGEWKQFFAEVTEAQRKVKRRIPADVDRGRYKHNRKRKKGHKHKEAKPQ